MSTRLQHHNRVTGLAHIIPYVDYGWQYDSMLQGWLKAKFDLTVEYNEYYDFTCWIGDYDIGIRYVTDRTIMGAALEYGACYDGELFDKLNKVELGE